MATVASGSFAAPRLDPVHFTEAIGFLRNKVELPTRAWTDLWQDQHSRAFVVAGAMKADLVTDFHEAVNKAIAEGTTLADFRKDFDKIVSRHGWSYKGSRGWRSRVIFETNMRTAYSAGRWSQAQRMKARRPYLRYVHADSVENPRPHHLAWHNTILPVDDPWWETHFTPNGWGCHCSTQSLSASDLRRYGWEVSKSAPPSRLVEHTLNTPDGPRTVKVPEGIDPGFGYNPGAGAFGRGTNAMAIARHGDEFVAIDAPSSMRSVAGRLEPQKPKAGVAPSPSLRPDGTPSEEALKRAFRDAFGGDEAIFADPLGEHVSITQAVTDHLLANPEPANLNRARYWPLVRELIEEPQEIWMGFARHEASGRVYLRRRYVKLFDLGKDESGKERIIGLIADEEAGQWQSVTVLAGRQGKQLDNLRSGLRVF